VVSCSLSLAGDTVASSDDTMSRQVVVVKAAGRSRGKRRWPLEFRLELPRPSVFGRSVAIAFALPHRPMSRLRSMTPTGAVVRQLRHGSIAAGEYRLSWDGRNDRGRTVPAGTYFCRLDAGDQRATRGAPETLGRNTIDTLSGRRCVSCGRIGFQRRVTVSRDSPRSTRPFDTSPLLSATAF